MTASTDTGRPDDEFPDDDKFDGRAAEFSNVARAQVQAFCDKLEAMAQEGRDLIVDMDARLERFDERNRRLTLTETESRKRRDESDRSNERSRERRSANEREAAKA